ncbi:LysR substrate-binding domain-containing protein [Azospirillum agricola]|uniref:LysR substrate-binding domain-containing protein n=1 Tax=Azospirillum agricola TaxID=1720247 RepID=UPI000A0F1EB0|nr:LysR substrate-binding domain-containing protein [Azospirillum agricola]MBP2232373.1 DNA-binding transcriptional LysR family regulator [Azospirillum agricola]SMH62991.1 transcriptional regulator, LysR family [Azospirillum lipoferum]
MSDPRAWEMRVFLRVAALGSFSAAGAEIGMTPSATAKLIARIEARLGVRLIERSTRRLRLTDEGELYREKAEILLGELDAFDAEIVGGARSPTGTIRVNVSVPFGRHCVLPLLPDFMAAYPDIRLDLTLTDEVVDLHAAHVDVAFRAGRLPDSTLLAIRLGDVRRRIVASPDYLARKGAPRAATDLEMHDCLGFNFRRAAAVWPLKSGGRLVDREVHGRIEANNGETVRHLALLGLGLARLAEFHVRDDIAAGRLVTVLDDAMVDSEEIHAIHIGRDRAPRRVRAFLDFTTPRLRAMLQ